MLWMLHEFNWPAYEEGRQACLNNKPGNPYEPETNEWYSWNKGWNVCDNCWDEVPKKDKPKVTKNSK